MAEKPTLEQVQAKEQKLKTTIFRYKRKFKQLTNSAFLPDIEACKEFKQELTNTIDQLEETHSFIIQEFSETVDPEKESEMFENVLSDFLTLLDAANRLLLKLQFNQQSSRVDTKIKVLEQNMHDDTEATMIENIKDAEDLLDSLSSMQLTSTEDSEKLENFTSRLAMLRIESDKRLKTEVIAMRSSASSPSPSLESDPKPSTGKVHVRLPKLELPSFDGDYLNWPIFWERFSTAIDQNSSLSDEEKLAYLRGAMKGKLAQQIASPPIGEVHTYSTILNLLKEEYDNPREIHRMHVKALFEAKGYAYNHEDVSKLKATWEKHLAGLKNTKKFDAEHILTSVAVLNMSPKFYTEWSKFTSSYEDIPSIDIFQKFLKELSKTLRRDSEDPSMSKVHQSSSANQSKKTKAYVHVIEESNKCLICSNDYHPLYYCPVFKSASIENRMGLAKKANICTNCLNGGHKYKDCKSSKRCQTCNNKHHSMLHREDKSPATTANVNSTSETVTSMNSVLLSSHSAFSSSLLMTTQAIIKSPSGRRLKIRVLLDSGSSASLVTRQVVTQLGLHKDRRHTIIKGIQGDSAKPSQFTTSFCAEANSPHKEIAITAAVVDHITSHLPVKAIDEAKSWEVIQDLQLADPTFHIPGRIDALFGMDVLSDILLNGMLSGRSTEPKAFKTIFGWVIAGNYQGRVEQAATSFQISYEEGESLDELLQKFWSSEEPPALSSPFNLTDEDQSVVDNFHKTTVRDESGRYQVS